VDNILGKTKYKNPVFLPAKTSEFNDIVETQSDIIDGFYVNNKAVETRIDRFIYRNGKVLTKIYRYNRLCMIQIANA
jgi:hypothetical protein